MKIYSKYKDYYDSALGSFLDSYVVFNRNPELLFLNYREHRELGKDFHGTLHSSEGFLRDHPTLFTGEIESKLISRAHLYSFWIGFCGKYYPFVTPSGSFGDLICGNEAAERANELFPKFINPNGRFTCEPVSFDDIRKYTSFSWDFERKIGLTPKLDEDYRDPNTCDYWKDRAFRELGPVFLMVYPSVPYTTAAEEKKVITIFKNVCLKTFGFQKVKDPFTALWEIEHWIDTHARPDDAVVPVGDDLTRLKSHGFDPKTSFRKPKMEKR